MAIFTVGATVTISGAISIEANSPQEAKEKLAAMLDEDESLFVKYCDVSHRELDVHGADEQ
jgi:hypothetical protein